MDTPITAPSHCVGIRPAVPGSIPMTWHLNDDGAFTRHAQQPGFTLMRDLGLEPADLLQHDAHHEAGHAVLALVHGIPVTRVTTIPNHQHAAHVQFAAWSGMWWSFAVTMAAGERAGERWMREVGLATPERLWNAERHCASDRHQIVETAPEPHAVVFGQMDAPDGRQALDYLSLCEAADALLTGFWPHVRTLAAELVEHRELTGRQVADISGLPLPAPPPVTIRRSPRAATGDTR
ncbi:hypothetical protein [Streptomyces rubradiris]|nr:hypothetical protein [Streptomyces rubradiris]